MLLSSDMLSAPFERAAGVDMVATDPEGCRIIALPVEITRRCKNYSFSTSSSLEAVITIQCPGA